ncbi:hypothetical protein B0A67_13165 [Flavobacterium aquidurense]|uniref:hypothetical protein n=1 Tax=Flavobacterium aquidurense TaxID=362413 RepID=UPI00091705FF|nr:hypothetical protein [Flavobacterium aquidurense]OXA71208.1 hypothetical protein B0A67_13165 [Flavobacterium aquidurense]SHG68257.1 hypothetical protein SAMN05444481_106181 [Flavobacterium frigidimaris]
MTKTIKLRVKKEIDRNSEFKVLKLKGSLITKGFTEIIHIEDENENFYLNSFSTSAENKKEADDFILDYISVNNLSETITLISTINNNF